MNDRDQQLLKRALALIDRALNGDYAKRLKEQTGSPVISRCLEEDLDQLLRDARSAGL